MIDRRQSVIPGYKGCQIVGQRVELAPSLGVSAAMASLACRTTSGSGVSDNRTFAIVACRCEYQHGQAKSNGVCMGRSR